MNYNEKLASLSIQEAEDTNDIYSNCENGLEFFNKIWDKGRELTDEFNS